MITSPLQILSLWLRGLIAVILIGLSVWLWKEWYDESHVTTPAVVREDGTIVRPAERRFEYHPGLNRQTALLAAALVTSLWSIGGGLLFERLRHRKGGDRLDHHRRGRGNELTRPDGSVIHVETDGPADGPTVILSHGWGMDGAEWNAIRGTLAQRCRMVIWDMPGLGYSSPPPGNDYSVAQLASDLRRVVEFAGDRPAVLVGHSAGGMAIEELCRTWPELQADGRVAGVVLAHTTYTNPLRTMKRAEMYTKLQKPVIEPVLRASVPLSPALRVMACLSYLNGSAHRSAERSGFSGRESWEALDFVARYEMKSSPAVLARGVLGMIRWDDEWALGGITVPTLVVVGGQDPTTCPEAGERIRAGVTGPAGLHAFADGKHQGVVEYHGEFANWVLQFVEQCIGRPRAQAPARIGAGGGRPESAAGGGGADRRRAGNRGAGRLEGSKYHEGGLTRGPETSETAAPPAARARYDDAGQQRKGQRMAIERLSDVHAEFARRFNAGDVEVMLGWYDEGARLVLPEGMRVGHDAIRDALIRLMDYKGKMRMETIGIVEGDGVALGGSNWRIEAEDGKILAQGESVEVFRKGPDGWLATIDCPFGVG